MNNWISWVVPFKEPYTYTGKKEETMHSLGWYDYGKRFYDPNYRLSFISIDPLCEKYYSISPYAYCTNNPVNAIDLRGDTIAYAINSTTINPDGTVSINSNTFYYGQDANGNYGFINVSNGQMYSGNDVYLNNLTVAINHLRTGGNAGNVLVSDLTNSTNTVQIVAGKKNSAAPNGAWIRWNSTSAEGGMNTMGNEHRPSYIGLGHEMAHIQDTWNGTIDNSAWVTVRNTTIPNSEKYATHIENQLRAENGIPLRTHYGIDVSTGTRVGLESTRIIRGATSLFYWQPNRITSTGMPSLPMPFFYKR